MDGVAEFLCPPEQGPRVGSARTTKDVPCRDVDGAAADGLRGRADVKDEDNCRAMQRTPACGLDSGEGGKQFSNKLVLGTAAIHLSSIVREGTLPRTG